MTLSSIARGTAGILVAITVCCAVGCKSADILEPKKPAPPADAPTEQSVVPQRDEREDGSNLLALLEEKNRENAGLRREVADLRAKGESVRGEHAAAKSSEMKLALDIERLEGLLRDAGNREKDLQQKLLRARIETVHAERELYKTQMEALVTGGTTHVGK